MSGIFQQITRGQSKGTSSREDRLSSSAGSAQYRPPQGHADPPGSQILDPRDDYSWVQRQSVAAKIGPSIPSRGSSVLPVRPDISVAADPEELNAPVRRIARYDR
jgi:hypothetical protein